MVPVSAKVAARSNRMFSALRALLLTGLAFAALPHSVGAQYFPANSIPQTFDDQTTSGVVMLGRKDGLLGPYGNTGYFGPYLHLQHIAGDGPGYRDNGFTTLGIFAPKKLGQGMLFTEGRLSVNDFGNMLGNIGVGLRRFSPDRNRTYGGSFWYDIDGGHNGTFTQIGAGLETRGENWDMFANFYLPVAEDDKQFNQIVTPTGQQIFNFQGRNLSANLPNLVTRQFESAMRGADFEFGGPLPVLGKYGIRGYGGYYHFYKDNISNINGGRFRVQAALTDSLTGQFMLTNDNEFDTSVIFSLALTLPGSGASRSPLARPGFNRTGRTVVRAQSPTNQQSTSQWYRMFQPTQRSSRVFVATRNVQTVEENSMLLVDPATGQPIVVFHLDSRAAVGGDGSFESPFSTPQDAENGTGNGAVIFAHAGSVFNNATNNFIALQTNQRLLGEGVPHLINTGQLGPVLLPASGDVGGLPIFQGGMGGVNMAAITMANGSTLSGFIINNSGNAGILANNTLTGTANVQNTTINGATIGLDLQGVSGTFNFATTSSVNNTAGQTLRFNNLAAGSIVNIAGGVNHNGTGNGAGMVGSIDIQNSSGAVTIADANLNITTAGNAVTLTNNQLATIRFNDLDITTAAGGGLLAKDSGTVTVDGGNIMTTGGPAMLIDPTAVNLRFNNVTSINSLTVGIGLDRVSGTVNIDGTTTITNPMGRGIEFIDSSADFTIATLNITGTNAANGTMGEAIFLQDTSGAMPDLLTGTFTVGNGLVQRTANLSDTFRIDGGIATVNFGANINHSVAAGIANTNAMVNIFDTTRTGTVNFTGTLVANNGTGLQFNNADGNYNFTGTTTLDGSGAGADTGIDILGASDGMFTFGAATSIVNPTGDAFAVNGDNTNNPSITYSGTIANAAGNAVSIQNTAAGGNLITFNSVMPNAIADSGTGIFLNNVAQNVNFTADTELVGAEGIDVNGGSGTFTFTDTDITNVTGAAGIDINGGSADVNLQAASSITQTANAQSLVNVTNGHSGLLTLAGTASATTVNTGDGLQFNNADGVYNFTGMVTLAGADAGIDILNGSAGTFTFTDTTITSPTGTAFNVDASSANVNFLMSSSITQANNVVAVNVNNHTTGTLDFDGDVTATNGTGLQFNNADGIYRFDGTTVLNGGDAGIDILNGSAGTFTFTDTTITSPTGTAFNVDGSSANVNFLTNSSITQANNAVAVNVINHSAGTLDFDGDVTATMGTGLQFNNADGVYRFDGATVLNGGDAGVDILADSSGTFTFTNTTITSPTGIAFNVAASSANVNFLMNSSITQANNAVAVNVLNHTTGTLDFDGDITATMGTGLQFNNADGVYRFDGINSLTGGTAGIDIIGGSNGTFSFGANTNIAGRTAAAFVVSGDNTNTPTVTYTGTIANTADDVIRIENTGAGGPITFNSTMANAITDTGTGIFLNNTGQTVLFTADVELTGSEGIDINGGSGTYTFTDTDINVAGLSFDVAGGTSSVNFLTNSSITQASANPALNVLNHGIGTLDFNGDITATLGTGIVFNNADGTYSLDGTNTISGGGGIDIVNTSSGTFTFGTTSITGATGNAIEIDGHIGTITFGSTTIDMAGGNGIDIANSTGTYNFTGAANVISNLAAGADGVQVTEAAGTLALQNFTIGPVAAGQFGITVNTNGGGALGLTLSSNSVDLNNAAGTGYAVTADGAGNNITFSGSNGAANDNVTIDGGAGMPFVPQEIGATITGTVRINGMDLMP